MNAKQRQLRLVDYLDHMRDAARLAQGYTAGLSKADFLDNQMAQQAVMMNLVIIGEAATQIRNEYPDFLAANPNPALPWSQVIGMRNRMTHGYFDVDLQLVWDTVKTRLPPLEFFLTHEIQQSPGNDGPENDFPPSIEFDR
jgi:uncharacterized protein with HEPN domain